MLSGHSRFMNGNENYAIFNEYRFHGSIGTHTMDVDQTKWLIGEEDDTARLRMLSWNVK